MRKVVLIAASVFAIFMLSMTAFADVDYGEGLAKEYGDQNVHQTSIPVMHKGQNKAVSFTIEVGTYIL